MIRDIIAKMEAYGITQAQVAKESGVSTSHVSALLGDKVIHRVSSAVDTLIERKKLDQEALDEFS